ncbi:MAG: C25 family cysteine peptidase [Candidatus Cloacimonadaceae bacterium]
MKKAMLLILMCLPILLAAEMSLKVTVPDMNISKGLAEAKVPLLMRSGNPALPFWPVKILLPMGEKVANVQVTCLQPKTVRQNIALDYVRSPQPTNQSLADKTVKNPDIWNADAFYPSSDFNFLGEQQWCGYRLAIINLYPWQYNPVRKELAFASEFHLIIETEQDTDLGAEQAVMLRNDSEISSLLNQSVINPDLQFTYHNTGMHTPHTRYIDPTQPKSMLIITSQNRLNWFSAYANWKNSANIPTGIVAIESILTDYAGIDNAAKLRAFIIDAYQTWVSTTSPLQYVILAGDDEIIPVRGLYGHVGDTVDNFMPSDLYFGCLDGNWNADQDNLWGEYPSDNPDLLPEVMVGRFPAETQTEFQHIMDKTMYYVNHDTFSNNIALFFGENLNWDPVTWGGDYKDAVAVYLPSGYHLETHYQRDGTYSAPVVIDAINNGGAIMNHMGHSNQSFLMGQSNGNVEALTNTEYGFLYTQGCYPAAFDQRTSGDAEAIGEHFVTASGGLFAFIGNTRYGWYMPGSINGPSEYFDREFFNGMFQHNLLRFGQAMEYSLLENLNYAMQEEVMLWCYYETILFGDPSTAVKLPNPTLPCLTLEGYKYDDSEGDGDGNLNPGEIIRLYPKVRNLAGWGTAHNVSITVEALPTGLTLLNGSINIPSLAAGALSDTTLCLRFQLPEEMSFGNYTFKIRVTASEQTSGALVCNRQYNADMEITLLDSHFPWECYKSGKSAPVVGDLQFNNQHQILFADVTGNGHFINEAGQEVSSFDFPTEENLNRSFAAGPYELINTPMYSYAFASRTGHIYAVAHKDTVNFFYLNYDTGSTCLFTPILADINSDGLNEIIASAYNNKIYALNYENQLLAGFPTELTAPASCELAVADIDNDGSAEIIAGTTDGKLWAIESEGTIKTGFPVQLSGSVNGSPVILNNNTTAVGTHNQLYLIAPDGSVIMSRQINGDIAGGAIPLDLDRNGELDIVFVTSNGTLYACRQDGSDFNNFPVQTGCFFNCPPLAADINGDAQYEIILQDWLNSILIYDRHGSMLSGFPFYQNFNGATPATLADFDGDGKYELIAGYSNGVIVVKLRRPVGTMDAWVTYRGSLSRQGSFAATGFTANENGTSIPATDFISAYPNPFRNTTTFTLNLAKPEQRVALSVYNLKGQKIRTLHYGNLGKGNHEVRWDGRDDQGKSVGTGIYFCRLQTEQKSRTLKLLLLK